MLALEDELSGGTASVYSPELYQENYSFFFFAGASVPNRAFASPTVQSEVAEKVIYIPDYCRQAGKHNINYKKCNIFSQHILKTFNLNFVMKLTEQFLDRKSF